MFLNIPKLKVLIVSPMEGWGNYIKASIESLDPNFIDLIVLNEDHPTMLAEQREWQAKASKRLMRNRGVPDTTGKSWKKCFQQHARFRDALAAEFPDQPKACGASAIHPGRGRNISNISNFKS